MGKILNQKEKMKTTHMKKNPEPKKRKKIAKRCIKNKKNICINEVKTF